MDQIIPQMHVEPQQEMVLPGHKKGRDGFLEVVSTKQRLEGRLRHWALWPTSCQLVDSISLSAAPSAPL